jgi:predicted amidohydrolase
VGICYVNFFRFVVDALNLGDADIALMPYSAPTPQRTWYYGRKRAEAFVASYRHSAQNYARMLGIPAVQANKSGPWRSDLPAFFPAQNSKYEGQSEIADSNGTIVAQLADQEAVISGDVTLDPARKVRTLDEEYARHGRWISPVPLEFKLYRLIEVLGARSYRASERRREKALAISAGNDH